MVGSRPMERKKNELDDNVIVSPVQILNTVLRTLQQLKLLYPGY